MPDATSDRLPYLVRYSLEGSNHDPIAIVMEIAPDLRAQHLPVIFAEMGIVGARDRDAALRDIGDMLFDYERLRTALRKPLSQAATKVWYRAVGFHSAKLLKLLSSEGAAVGRLPHSVWSSSDLVAGLRVLNSNASLQVELFEEARAGLPKGTKRPDFATKRLVSNLAYWFHAVTGKRPTLSRQHLHHSPPAKEPAKPTGKFFKVVSAFFALIGEKRSPEAIASAMKRRDDMGKFGRS